ncbi:hypothetical protein BH23GEM6_BH23GEM6_27540 [soil metagenome]
MYLLKLFGGAFIETSTGPLTGRATQRHRMALLSLLATSGGMGREKLIEYLWPDHDLERGRHLLSDSVYRINKTLGADTIITAGDELRLDLRMLPCDVARFEKALEQGNTADALSVYDRPFLDGFFLAGSADFERWAERERQRLERLYRAAVEAMAEERERNGDFPAAIEWWYRLAAHDPFSSRIALRLMQALATVGDRAAALQHARIYQVLFQEEFGAQADPEVAAMAERLRGDTSGSPSLEAKGHDPVEADRLPVRTTPIQPEDAGKEQTPASHPAVPPHAVSSSGADRHTPLPTYTPSEKRRGVTHLVRFAALMVPLLIGLWFVWQRTGRSAVAALPSTVAVLPFVDHSPAGDHAYFGSGMTEEVASALAHVAGLRVVAHTGFLSTSEADVQEVGRRLGVEAVLLGSITRWGDSVRVNARLIRVADRAYLWSERYTSRLGSIFAIQDSISRAIVATLTEQLVGSEIPKLTEASIDVEAYNLYLKGRFEWHRRTEESLERAVDNFSQAVARAPTYDQHHPGLGDAYAVQGFYDYRSPEDAFSRAEQSARRALALDGSLAQPHATLGYVNLYHRWQWREAETEFQRSLQLDPAYSTAHQWYANYLTAMGRFTEAEQAMRRAMERDPLSLIANAALGWVFYYAGDYERSVEQCLRTLELDPSFQLAYLWSGLAYEQMGRSQEAIAMFEKSLALSPGSAITISALAHAHARNGRHQRATELLNELLSAEERYIPSFEVAKVYLAMGNRELALQWLETAYRQRSHSMAFLKVDPQLAPLRTDPRFLSLLRGVGHQL